MAITISGKTDFLEQLLAEELTKKGFTVEQLQEANKDLIKAETYDKIASVVHEDHDFATLGKKVSKIVKDADSTLLKEANNDLSNADLAKLHRGKFDELVKSNGDKTKQSFHRARAIKYENLAKQDLAKAKQNLAKTKSSGNPLNIPFGERGMTDSRGHKD